MKIHLKAVDVIAALNFVASGGLTAAFAAGGPRWVLYGSAATGIAGLLTRLFANKTGAPATAIVANAPVVPPQTPPTQIQDKTIATVISSTSKLLPKNGGST